jgi:malonyl-CoA/methylmalonyl-CoA synthetase
VALSTPRGQWTYEALAANSRGVSQRLLETARAAEDGARRHRAHDLAEARVCYLVSPGLDHVAVQWGIWGSGGVAVPMAVSHPPPELAYVLDDARPEMVVADPHHLARLAPLARSRGIPVLRTDDIVRPSEPEGPTLPVVEPSRPAMMLYTSGTTGRAKGVVSTHANIHAQIEALVDAWGWEASDRILHVLPLHHVHGIVNALCCALWSGATCEFQQPFDPTAVWERLAGRDITLFMAVPTIYHRLIQRWDEAGSGEREKWSSGARQLRLMVSGSAALPVPVLERWKRITGQTLLERYGMTEIGMGLSNPLAGERRPGTVGTPLPGVEARVVDERGTPVPDGQAGQIQIRGPQVFREYWGRPEETSEAFANGWFQTGDEAVVEDGYWRILGRRSVDILKSGGYKISALEVEAVLLDHPGISECAVVGVPDDEWGERVCAAVVVADGSTIDNDELRRWAKQRLAPYKVPRTMRCVDQLPRNAMGKVTKRAVAALFEAVQPPDRTRKEKTHT